MSKFLMVLVMFDVAGCSNRGVYEDIQASSRFECSELPLSQYDECMENANKSYNEYGRERKEVINQ